MKYFPSKKIILLLIIIVLPSILYYLLQEKGKNRYHPLRFYGPKKTGPTFHYKKNKKIVDTVYHTVSDFAFSNQENKLISFSATNNKISIINFFYTRCSFTCSESNKELARIVKIYEKNPMLQFFSISVDPTFDTPSVLEKYVSNFQEQSTKWHFLTGNKSEIYKLAKQDFLIDVISDSLQKNNIIHSSFFILTDPQKRIRGYYDSREKEQVDRLISEIRILIAEELRNVIRGKTKSIKSK